MVPAVMIGLVVLLALPAVGLATAALQVTDEPPHTLNEKDAAVLAPRSAIGTSNVTGPSVDPYSVPGALLARGTNAQPTGPFRLLTYELEEVTLPAGVPVSALGARANVRTLLRLSVLGGPFRVQSIRPVIWVDDVPLRLVSPNPELTRLSALVLDRSVLRNGAAIAVSYGESADQRQRLPESLSLGAGAR
jgi:hypothetical protein